MFWRSFFLGLTRSIDPDGHLRFSSPSFDDQDGEDAGERRAEVDVPHLLPGHHHAARRQVPPPEGTDRDAALGQGKQSKHATNSLIELGSSESLSNVLQKSGWTLDYTTSELVRRRKVALICDPRQISTTN